MLKRMISILLALVMVFTSIPWTAVAAEEQPDVTVQSDDLTVEGSNGIGNLLSAEIEEVQDAEEAAALSGCVITDLLVDGNTATVSYDAAEEAMLVVALYSEDGLQMLTSASAVISADAAEASVTFAGEMPDYFLARAYLVDPEDASPKSQAYETPVYTQAMQELLNSTVEDYDPALVVNFDDDPTTNFAVYHEGVVRVEETEGVNTVVTNDDENLLYVIENADETFTALQPGDVVSYFYGEEELLLCKVASVTVDGTTVTIHGDGALEMEEVFDHLKLDIMADNSDMEISGTEETSAQFAVGSDAPKLETDTSIDIKPFRVEFLDQEEDGLSGYIDVLLDNKMDFLYSRGNIYFRWELEYSISGNFSVTLENENDEREYSLPVFNNIKIGTVPAVGITFKPQFVIKASCSVTVNTTLSGSIGINCATGRDSINISKPMKMSDQLEIEGKLFIGFDLNPGIFFLHDKVFYIEMNVPVGGNISGTMTGTNFEAGDISFRPELEKHDCGTCIKGEIYASASIELSVKFFNKKDIELGSSVTIEFRSVYFYWSLTYGEIGWGKCPHKQYLVTVEVVDTEKKPVEGVRISLGEVGELTDAEGIAQAYLPAGTHNVTAEINGQTDSWAFTVSSVPSKLKIILGEESFTFKEYVDPFLLSHVTDQSMLSASGSCGDNVTWSYYDNGTLVIEGYGPMTDFEYTSSQPWPSNITQIFIREGVTHIGDLAFTFVGFNGGPLKSVHIADTVTSIGSSAFSSNWIPEIIIPDSVTRICDYAFQYCEGLTSMTIPDSVTYLGKGAFAGCTKLKEITLSSSMTQISDSTFDECKSLSQVTIPESIAEIGAYAFQDCTSLESVSLPSGLTKINGYAFCNNKMLKEITLPAGLAYIGNRAFYQSGLESIVIPDSVTQLKEGAFDNCESLSEVKLPTGISTIESSMFFGCSNLKEIVIPDNVTSIAYWAFSQCDGLENVVIPESVTSIEWSAFSGCTSLSGISLPGGITTVEKETFHNCGLTSIQIPDSVVAIKEGAFSNCAKLKDVTIPDSVTSIAASVFSGCTSLEHITIPDSVVSVGTFLFNGCTALRSAVLPDSITKIESNTFLNCSALESIEIPDGVTSIGQCAFEGCSKLSSIAIADSVQTLGDSVFNKCSSLANVTLPSNLGRIPNYCFQYCTGLKELVIPASVVSMGLYDVSTCDQLEKVIFEGSPPNMVFNTFYSTTTTAYYPQENGYWEETDLQDYGGTITWVPYSVDENGNMITGNQGITVYPAEDLLIEEPAEEPDPENAVLQESGSETTEGSAPTLDAIYGGEYGSEVTDEQILRTATFSGLVPNAEYVLLAMVSIDTVSPLEPDNLLYISQAEAGEDGSLTFTYVQRITIDPSYVVVSGPARKSLADAVITFPEMTADGALHAVNPTVVYDGEILQEGRDYVITGTVSYTEPGTYVCFIRGIHNYSGTMKCTYTVAEAAEPEEPELPTDPTDPTEPEEPTDPVEPEESGVIRIAGADRIDTSLGIADQLKRTLGVDQFRTVIVASALNFPDALTGSYLAAVKSAPILLTYHAANEKIAAYIGNNLAPGGTVYILGGSTAVSDGFEEMVSALNRYTVKRLAGTDRFGTNLAILEEAGVSRDQEILICTATGFADSLSASAAGLPILLVHGTLREDQKRFLEGTSGNFVIVGGTSAVSASLEAELDVIGNVERAAGENRYQTSVKVAKEFVSDPDAVVLAYARNFPDGLCGGPLAIALNAPLVLTDNYDPSEADTYVSGIRSGVVVGDSPLISDTAVRAIFDLSADTVIPGP